MEFPDMSEPSELSALVCTPVVGFAPVACALACKAHVQSSPPATSKTVFMRISFNERCCNFRCDETRQNRTASGPKTMGTRSARGRRTEANNSYKNLDSRLPVLSYRFSVGLDAGATHVGR
jgi:hypothetical protein